MTSVQGALATVINAQYALNQLVTSYYSLHIAILEEFQNSMIYHVVEIFIWMQPFKSGRFLVE